MIFIKILYGSNYNVLVAALTANAKWLLNYTKLNNYITYFQRINSFIDLSNYVNNEIKIIFSTKMYISGDSTIYFFVLHNFIFIKYYHTKYKCL